MANKAQQKEVQDMVNHLFDATESYCEMNNTSSNVVFNGLINILARIVIGMSRNIVDTMDIADNIKSAIIDMGVAYEINQEKDEKKT